MVLQQRDIQVLAQLATYFILNSRQIRELCFVDDSTGRITRRRLNKMVREGLIRKRNLQVVNPIDGSTSPCYHLARGGREFLAGHFDDEAYLTKPIEPSQPQHLNHYVAVSEMHRLFDRALTRHADVVIDPWCNEDEVINPTAPKSEQRKLRTSFEPTKIVCLPDAGFVLSYQDQHVVVLLEQDRDTDFYERVAAKKSPGYRELFVTRGHRKMFPNTTLEFFYVLVITPTAKRREQLRKAFTKNKRNHDHDVRKVYRFGSLDELNEHNLLFEPMFACCHHDDKVPLIKRIN